MDESPASSGSAARNAAPADSTPENDHPSDVYQRASETLHKLRQDITIFRDPEVRNHLQTIPYRRTSTTPTTPSNLAHSRAAAEPPAALTPQQYAAFIAQHTALEEANHDLHVAHQTDLSSRKRAARAEGQLAQLVEQNQIQQSTHATAVNAAALRISALEDAAKDAASKAADESARLVARVDKLTAALREADFAKQDAQRHIDAATARIDSLQKDHAASKRSYEAQCRSLQEALEEARALAKSPLAIPPSENPDGMSDVTCAATQAGTTSTVTDDPRVLQLEQENVRLKEELGWTSARTARAENDLRQAEELTSNLQSQLRQQSQGQAEAVELKRHIATLESGSGRIADGAEKIAALAREKEELRAMICKLSPSANATEGLDLLRKLGSGDRDAFKALAERLGTSGGDAMVDVDDGSSGEGLRDLQRRCKLLEVEVAKHRAEAQGTDVTQTMSEVQHKLLLKGLEEVKAGIGSSADGCALDVKSVVRVLKEAVVKQLEQKIVEQDELVAQLKQQVEDENDSDEDEAVCEGPADYDSATTKVLHLEDNPLQLAIAGFKSQEKKSKRLKRCGRGDATGVEEGGSVDSVTKAEVEAVKREMEEMRKEYDGLTQRAVLGDRTKKIALKRIEEVRSAVYNLFGWSMKVRGTMYLLSSLYAEDSDEVLSFCVNDQGSMSLVESGYAQRLQKELTQYVERMNSFPALLSHITMENFQKTTAFTG